MTMGLLPTSRPLLRNFISREVCSLGIRTIRIEKADSLNYRSRVKGEGVGLSSSQLLPSLLSAIKVPQG